MQQPITAKHTLVGKGKLGKSEVKWAVSGMQGWRVTMEDAHTHVLPVGSSDLGFFGVFDGHGGDLAAKYASTNVLSHIQNAEGFSEYHQTKDPKKLAKAMMEGFINCDEALKDLPDVKSGKDYSGSTGVAVIITEKDIIFANTGDSRSVLMSGERVKFATQDQKPSDAKETARVEAAGGMVKDNRVNGDLASARSFGDFRYKIDPNLPPSKQQITVLPETTVVPRSDEDQFLILACDGIWDVMSNFECANVVLTCMRLGCGLGTTCEKLLDECLMKSSGDNMSMMILQLPAAPKEIGKNKPGKDPTLEVIRDVMVNSVI